MSLVLHEKQKADLRILLNQSSTVLSDFSKLSWEVLKGEISPKILQSVSQKLCTDVPHVLSAVEGFVFLILETKRLQLTENDFRAATLSVGFVEEQLDTLWQEFLSWVGKLSEVVKETGLQHWHFHDLQWRLQAQVASRSRNDNIDPKVLLKLDLKKGAAVQSVALESDLSNIVHMASVLTQAVQEGRSQHARRMGRAVI